MFGIGFGEFIILALVLLVLIGPKQLPEVMKIVGKIVREFSKARRDLQKTIDQDESLRSIKDTVSEVHSTVKLKVDEISAGVRAKFLEAQTHEEEKAKAKEEVKQEVKQEAKPHES